MDATEYTLQSARLSVQSSELGPHTPSPAPQVSVASPGALYIIIPLRWTLYSAHPQTYIKQASGMTLKDDGNGFLSISKMCYIGNNKKLRRERFSSSATSELIFLDIKNIHCLIVYLTSRPLLLSEEVIFYLFSAQFG
jgi:hypothetical protein